MEGTFVRLFQPKEGDVVVNGDRLERLLNDVARGLRGKARTLDIPPTTLRRALRGGPVGPQLIDAALTLFPRQRYADLFCRYAEDSVSAKAAA